MPSVLIGGSISGGTPLFSGWPYSGHNVPVGGIQLRWDPNASGLAYVGLSGSVTIGSGGFYLSGGALASGANGLLDGFPLKPGDPYFIPKLAFPTFSGANNIVVACDAAASGQARMYWEIM